ncbi:MAG: AMP-binding protein [Gallionellaceae bacterium]|nr:AMP-binding protein [Gallionellaceae bacterium]
MSTLPLIAHRRLDAVMAWRGNTPVSVRQFLGDVDQLAGLLPPGRHVLNLCGDRYRFAVALMAGIVSGRVSLLPSSQTPESLRQMQSFAPDLFCITDRDDSGDGLPVLRYPEALPEALAGPVIPQIDRDQVIAQIFTSGSTGQPVPHLKRWGNMVRGVQAGAQRLGVGPGHAIVGTVPPQHMYGLEFTVLLPLQSGAALSAGHPFYPADICATLADLPRPRMLVTTPYHLRVLLAEPAEIPAVDLLLSATAPLSQNLAVAAEARLAAPLFEIYGSTETGQLASRRTTAGATWQTLPDIRLRGAGEAVWAEGERIEAPTRLSDVIEPVDPEARQFLLHGRHADLVNIAGKRSSLGYLDFQLNAVPGVQDGVFLLPREDDGDHPENVRRLTALVVAPGLTPTALMQALRERIDPIFLPRPLLFVDALPRDATGKLPRQATQKLLASLRAPGTDTIRS